MTHSVTPVAVVIAMACAACGQPMRPQTPDHGLDVTEVRCDGPQLPWTAPARTDAAKLLSESLRMPFGDAPLGIGGRSARTYVIIEPSGFPVSIPTNDRQVATRPAPIPGGEVEYWKISVGDRYTDGAVFVREQGTIHADGRISLAVEVVCAAYVRGRPTYLVVAGVDT